VQALEAAETLAVYHSDFEELRRRYPQVDQVLVLMLAREVRRMDDLLSESDSVSAERRVLRRLLEVADAYGGADAPLTQEQLAALAGTSRATVNAVLSAERQRGTVTLRRGRTTLSDPAALARRAGISARH
jgi:CRP-like cAMP-binding protein